MTATRESEMRVFLVVHLHGAPRRADIMHRSEAAAASLTPECERDDPLSSDGRARKHPVVFAVCVGFIFESLPRPRGQQSVFCSSGGKKKTSVSLNLKAAEHTLNFPRTPHESCREKATT